MDTTEKNHRYQEALKQIDAMVQHEPDLIANMANVAALLHETFPFLWTGFYRVCGDSLVLGPFQGPIACTRIARGRGVCGTAWKEMRTVIVPDVKRFPGHIACSGLSRSEIVVPLMLADQYDIKGVLDIDSEVLNAFDEIDGYYLEEIVRRLLSPQA